MTRKTRVAMRWGDSVAVSGPDEGGRSPQVKAAGGPQTREKTRMETVPWRPQEEPALPTSWSQSSEEPCQHSPTCKTKIMINLCGFKWQSSRYLSKLDLLECFMGP